jgi:hypothetical protein
MPVEQDQRPQYFQGQYLGPEDLTAAVEYGRIQHERHCLGAHSWGIAIGLQLVEKPSPAGNNQVDVFLTPGYAWDGFGRSIVVLAPYKIPADLFKSIVFDAAIDGGKPPGRLVKVWVHYRESESRPPLAGFEVCDVADQNSRIQETFQVEVGERPNVSDQRDPLSIAGKQVDALTALQLKGFDPSAPKVYDLSIPHQALPEDDATASWLIPVGYVRWLPNSNPTMPGSFQQNQDKAAGNALRQYIGVVAGAVLAAGNNVRVRDRATDPTTAAPSDDLLWVEGSLRVQQKDLRLFGGRLSFLDASGQDNNGIPLMLQRSNQPGSSSSLQAVIGKGHDGKNTFAVGPLDPNNNSFVPKLTVQDDGKVGIGTAQPTNPLHVGDVLGIRQKYLYLSGDAGGSSVSYNAHRDSANQNWVFPDPTRPAVTIEMDDAPGPPRFEVWSKPASANAADWRRRFTIKGDSGDVGIAENGGNVGVGTASPGARLHVTGGDIMWGNNSRLVADQGGSIELGGDNVTQGTGTPYIDFHFKDLAEDYNTRIINDANGRLGLIAQTVAISNDLLVHNNGSVDGNLTINGALLNPSDVRLKTNVVPLSEALANLLRLRGVGFQWREPEKMGGQNGVQMGLIAQEVEEVFPQWVSEGRNGYKLLGTRGFEALVIEAVRELKAQLDELRAHLKTQIADKHPA